MKHKILISFTAMIFILPALSYSVQEQPRFVWSGSISENSARITAATVSDSVAVRIAYGLNPALTNLSFTPAKTSNQLDNQRVLTFQIENLLSDMDYYYAVEIDGILSDSLVGHFRTFPVGLASFDIAFASCSWTGSTHPVFTTIMNNQPLFFLHMGDMHYENIAVNNPVLFRDAFEQILGSATQSELYRKVPIAYVWDDHDFGPNNSDSTSPSRTASRAVYQQYVPHYPLVEGSGDVAIYQAFTVGRVRFVLCDSRSARSPAVAVDDLSKTMLGVTQKNWFKNELIDARDNYALVVWMNSLPWIGSTGDDGWYLYTNERREIANFLKDNQIKNLCMLSGDAHMIAIDDGTNSDYADGGGAPFPVMHAAPLDRTVSIKGGPYSEGVYTGNGLFGMMSVDDRGDSIFVTWSGRNSLNQELVAYSFAYEVNLQTSVDDPAESDLVPDEFELFQNFPNPFNGATTISFNLVRAEAVEVEVLNVLGQQVAALYSGPLEVGRHEFVWDGRSQEGQDVSSGAYFYRVNVKGQSKSGRMVLLK